jgi:hypothetical protein
MTKPPMTEADWQAQVGEIADLGGWWRYHTYDSRRSAPGWPDLALVRPPFLILAELKNDKRQPTEEQRNCLDMLGQCEYVEAHLWRPKDFDRVWARLR